MFALILSENGKVEFVGPYGIYDFHSLVERKTKYVVIGPKSIFRMVKLLLLNIFCEEKQGRGESGSRKACNF